jgi:prepilin-type processing-associated H-X9-DG protein
MCGRVPEARVRALSEMIAVADGAWSTIGPLTNWAVPDARHTGARANVLHADGHVEPLKKALLLEATPEARSKWNNDHQPHRETWVP